MGNSVPAYLSIHRDGALLRIRLQPRARQTGFTGMVGDRLKIGVSGPPVDGKANLELCRFLATTLGVPKSAVVIMHGATSREKSVLIRGVSPTAVAARISA